MANRVDLYEKTPICSRSCVSFSTFVAIFMTLMVEPLVFTDTMNGPKESNDNNPLALRTL